MVFSAALRRAVSSAACGAARAALKGPATTKYHSVAGLSRSLLRPASELRRESIRALPTFRLMATSADSSLLRVIDAEIECAVESGDHEQADDIPNKFPFQIQDEPGTGSVLLTRDFHGEKIEVIVSMPTLADDEDEEDQGEDNDNQQGQQDDDNQTQSSLPLVVNVSKGDGPTLEFYCTAFADEIQIESLTVKEGGEEDDLGYEGPEFSDLDENLQKSFHKYLEIRGISPATTNFLHEYMINKDSREYLVWMKKLKEFVSK